MKYYFIPLALWLAMIVGKLCGYGSASWMLLLWPLLIAATVLLLAFTIVVLVVGIKAIFMGR